MSGYGKLPANTFRAGGTILDGTGLPRLPVRAAMAEWFRLSAVRAFEGLATGARNGSMPSMFMPNFCDGRNDLSPHAQTFDDVVSHDLMGDESKDRRQRPGIAANSGTRKLQDRLVLAPQTSAGDDPTRSGTIVGKSRG